MTPEQYDALVEIRRIASPAENPELDGCAVCLWIFAEADAALRRQPPREVLVQAVESRRIITDAGYADRSPGWPDGDSVTIVEGAGFVLTPPASHGEARPARLLKALARALGVSDE